MTDQSNSAAERSAHVTRGEKPAPAEWPVARMPDGTWKLKSILALEARIAELEAALHEIVNICLVTCLRPGIEAQKMQSIAMAVLTKCNCAGQCNQYGECISKARAALAGGKDG